MILIVNRAKYLQKAMSSSKTTGTWKSKGNNSNSTCVIRISLNPKTLGRINWISTEVKDLTAYPKEDLVN